MSPVEIKEDINFMILFSFFGSRCNKTVSDFDDSDSKTKLTLSGVTTFIEAFPKTLSRLKLFLLLQSMNSIELLANLFNLRFRLFGVRLELKMYHFCRFFKLIINSICLIISSDKNS